MKRFLFTLAALSVLCFSAVADDRDDYRQWAEQVRQEVWSKPLSAFQQQACPNEYKKHSVVVLAAYEEVVVDQHNKADAAMLLLTWQIMRQVSVSYCHRTLLAINDQAARDRFSQYDFMSISRGYGFWGKEKQQAMLGIRIIKPDGTVREVSTDDYVRTAEGRKGKEERSKLAVPDLQVGDLMDVFTYSVSELNERSTDPFVFRFRGPYPILSNQVHCVIDPTMTTQYRTLNGAPDFRESKDENGNIVLDALVEKPAEAEPSVWYDQMSQTPMTKLCITGRWLKGQWAPPSTAKKGLQANPDYEAIVDDDIAFLKKANYERGGLSGKENTQWKKYCEDLAAMNLPKEEHVARLYTGLYYHLLFSKTGSMNAGVFLAMLRQALQKSAIVGRQLFTTDDSREPIDQLISYRNTTWGLYVKSIDKVLFPPAYEMAPFTIPSQLQGRKAISDYGVKENMILPKSTADDNTETTKLKVAIDGTSLRCHRQTMATGTAKEPLCKALVMTEDLLAAFNRYLGTDKTLEDLVGKKELDDMAEWKRLQREKERKMYEAEAAVYHGTDVSEMKDYGVDCIGFRADSTQFKMHATYKVDGLLKKAGPDMVLSVGRLISTQRKIEGTDRERTDDIVYEFTALNANYDVEVELPEGYTVTPESLQSLNVRVSNACGTFQTKAEVIDGMESQRLAASPRGILRLTVVKRYEHAKEPAANWPQILEFIDAATQFNAVQVVLTRL